MRGCEMIKPYSLPTRQTGNQYHKWRTATCPICHESYEYNGYKPPTCGRFNCLKLASLRGMLK